MSQHPADKAVVIEALTRHYLNGDPQMTAEKKYTPIQQRILTMLSDGLSHTAEELRGCLSDEFVDLAAVTQHIHHLRQKLKEKGQDILHRKRDGVSSYAHVRVVPIRDE
jgi:hypothetical protein